MVCSFAVIWIMTDPDPNSRKGRTLKGAASRLNGLIKLA